MSEPRMNRYSDGTVTFHCPVCDQTVPMPNDHEVPDGFAAWVGGALGTSGEAMTAIWADQTNRRTERALQDHLSTHPPAEWFPVLCRALQNVTIAYLP